MKIDQIPEIRIECQNEESIREGGEYVLYWMIANRRTHANFALQHALWRAQELGKPLLVLEALRLGYEWASDRLHTFVLQGMNDTRSVFDEVGLTCLTYVEREEGAGSGLLEALAESACLVVTDEFPCFFCPE